VRPIAAAVAVVVASFARRVGAVERETQVGVDAGTAILVLSDKTDVGGGVGGHWSYGLNDVFNLMAEATWSLVALGESAQNVHTPRTRPTNVANVGVGMAYVFDVLKWVPYAGLLASSYALLGGTLEHPRFPLGATAALGLDYRFSRQWAAGVAFRQHFLLTDMSTYPSFTHVFARIEYSWGW
jgi:hypothetical protein